MFENFAPYVGTLVFAGIVMLVTLLVVFSASTGTQGTDTRDWDNWNR